jgi:hypothetical protein
MLKMRRDRTSSQTVEYKDQEEIIGGDCILYSKTNKKNNQIMLSYNNYEGVGESGTITN